MEFPSLANACKLFMAWLVELKSPTKRSASVKDGVGLGFELDLTTPVSLGISTFSARLANCWRLYSWILVRPRMWPDIVTGAAVDTRGGMSELFIGGTVKDESPSNEDCKEAGSEIGELALTELGQPIDV